MSHETQNTMIVISAYNEEDNIAPVVQGVKPFGSVIVVDDGSRDRTAARAEAAGATVVRHARNTHIKQAYVDGFRQALRMNAKWIIQMDAGLSHRPEDIPAILSGLHEADLVIGSRFIAPGRLVNQTLRRRLLSCAGSFLIRSATGLNVRDQTSGFRGYRAELLRLLDRQGVLDRLKARAFAFIFELAAEIYKRGYKIKEVPIVYTATGSSLNARVILEALQVVGRLCDERIAARRSKPK